MKSPTGVCEPLRYFKKNVRSLRTRWGRRRVLLPTIPSPHAPSPSAPSPRLPTEVTACDGCTSHRPPTLRRQKGSRPRSSSARLRGAHTPDSQARAHLLGQLGLGPGDLNPQASPRPPHAADNEQFSIHCAKCKARGARERDDFHGRRSEDASGGGDVRALQDGERLSGKVEPHGPQRQQRPQ